MEAGLDRQACARASGRCLDPCSHRLVRARQAASPPLSMLLAVVSLLLGCQLGAVHGQGVLAAGRDHMCVVRSNATFACRGSNTYSQLGPNRSSGVLEVHAGLAFSCARLATNASCWGSMWSGSANAYVSAAAVVSEPVSQLSLGHNHACIISNSPAGAPQAKCWGWNGRGALGYADYKDRAYSSTALKPVNMSRSAAQQLQGLALGASHTCAWFSDGSATCWGGNSQGQLGMDSKRDSNAPGAGVVDLGGARVLKLVAGSNHTCALLEDASVKCWGANDSGQLGLGDVDNRGDAPGEMHDLQPVSLGGAGVMDIAAGFAHACAVLDDGSVKCWGSNRSGQLGLGHNRSIGGKSGEMGSALAPVSLGTRQAKAVRVYAGGDETCALLEAAPPKSNTAKCWGSNQNGQLNSSTSGTRKNIGDNAGEMGDQLPPLLDLAPPPLLPQLRIPLPPPAPLPLPSPPPANPLPPPLASPTPISDSSSGHSMLGVAVGVPLGGTLLALLAALGIALARRVAAGRSLNLPAAAAEAARDVSPLITELVKGVPVVGQLLSTAVNTLQESINKACTNVENCRRLADLVARGLAEMQAVRDPAAAADPATNQLKEALEDAAKLVQSFGPERWLGRLAAAAKDTVDFEKAHNNITAAMKALNLNAVGQDAPHFALDATVDKLRQKVKQLGSSEDITVALGNLKPDVAFKNLKGMLLTSKQVDETEIKDGIARQVAVVAHVPTSLAISFRQFWISRINQDGPSLALVVYHLRQEVGLTAWSAAEAALRERPGVPLLCIDEPLEVLLQAALDLEHDGKVQAAELGVFHDVSVQLVRKHGPPEQAGKPHADLDLAACVEAHARFADLAPLTKYVDNQLTEISGCLQFSSSGSQLTPSDHPLDIYVRSYKDDANRLTLFKDIIAWQRSGPARLLAITGKQDAGKTSVAAVLKHRQKLPAAGGAEPLPLVQAAHFFHRKYDQICRDPTEAVKHIAVQLARELPQLRTPMLEILRGKQGHPAEPNRLFARVVAQALKAACDSGWLPDGCTIWLDALDALDMLGPANERSDQLLDLLSLVANDRLQLPGNVRFIVTLRPDSNFGRQLLKDQQFKGKVMQLKLEPHRA